MTEWKPEKNITSPWDVNVWENNIGQPVLDTYPASVQNNTYIPPVGTLHIGSKWYDVDTTKLTSIKDVEALFSAIGLKVSETNENFDKVKHLLIIPEKPKTLDEIQQEFDEKIDKQIEDVEYKFAQLKYYQEYQFSKKITRIIEDIEYARKTGSFPPKLTLDYSKLTATGSNITSNFVIKEGGKEVGYYTFGSGYFRYYMNKKPTVISRWFMNKLLGFRWVSV